MANDTILIYFSDRAAGVTVPERAELAQKRHQIGVFHA